MTNLADFFFPVPKTEKKRTAWKVTETEIPFGSSTSFSNQEQEL